MRPNLSKPMWIVSTGAGLRYRLMSHCRLGMDRFIPGSCIPHETRSILAA